MLVVLAAVGRPVSQPVSGLACAIHSEARTTTEEQLRCCKSKKEVHRSRSARQATGLAMAAQHVQKKEPANKQTFSLSFVRSLVIGNFAHRIAGGALGRLGRLRQSGR